VLKRFQSSPFLKRLFKNKGAFFGLILIVVSLLLALLCYFISPDPSPNANRMIPEIGSKKPGFAILLLRTKRDKLVDETGFFKRLISGAEESYQYVPIISYTVSKDSIVYQKFVDEGITERRSILISLAGDPPVVKTTYYLGTDKFGRDILSRLLIGVRVSLSVGLIAVLISLTIGILLGAIAGYFRGWVDDLIMWFINVIWSIPTLLLVFAITLALGKGFWQVFIAVGLTMWVNVARLVRGQVLAVRELEYIEATRALGYSHARTIFRHILPNILGPCNGDRRKQFCIGDCDRSRIKFPRRRRSAPATQLGVDDQRELQFYHHPQSHARISTRYCDHVIGTRV
jgi:ABC-type dipeptide/oligopeptide/nickel transport system permease subunit